MHQLTLFLVNIWVAAVVLVVGEQAIRGGDGSCFSKSVNKFYSDCKFDEFEPEVLLDFCLLHVYKLKFWNPFQD